MLQTGLAHQPWRTRPLPREEVQQFDHVLQVLVRPLRTSWCRVRHRILELSCVLRLHLTWGPKLTVLRDNEALHNAWSPIIAALFSGNSVVLKCSEHVVWSTTWFVQAIRECLKACGHDEELVQVRPLAYVARCGTKSATQLVCCYPEEASALTESPFIRHITFIGSERVGRIVAQAATTYLTPVTLELGGKDPAIILPSTDLEKYISLLMRGV